MAETGAKASEKALGKVMDNAGKAKQNAVDGAKKTDKVTKSLFNKAKDAITPDVSGKTSGIDKSKLNGMSRGQMAENVLGGIKGSLDTTQEVQVSGYGSFGS